MKVKVSRVDMKEINIYKNILDKYGANYDIDPLNGKTENFAVIEVSRLEELFNLSKDLGHDLIINEFNGSITIFDDYL
ncbi:hypothetical protein [Bacillus infantis]|uniref:hypothetical protein n=1 Tax=Bacillus infantis TaxID=324767 RepID=UPI003CED93A8